MIVHEKGFQFHAQPQTDAYSCSTKVLSPVPATIGLATLIDALNS